MLKELQVAMVEVSKFSRHQGYWYSVQDVLIVMVLGLLCGIKTIESIYNWSRVEHIREFIKKEFSIEKFPRKAQFYNILTYVDYKAFSVEFEKWMFEVMQGGLQGQTIAIDGKSICSTAKLSHDKSIVHIASAIVANSGIILTSKECTHQKSSEVGAFREIVKALQLKGTVVVADALHCKPKSAEAVIEAKADYLFVVKDNNKNLKESIDLLSHNKKTDEFSTVEKNGGRIETRTAYLSDKIATLYNKENWKKVACVGAIHREFEKNGTKSSQWHYYISSKKMTAKELLHHARLEWRVESMHWLLDVHFLEDKTKVRDMEVQKNLNILRKVALNLVKDYQSSLVKPIPLSRILEQNLFDIKHLSTFIAHFRKNTELE